MQETDQNISGEWLSAPLETQWERFVRLREPGLRQRLIEHYLNFARTVAAKLYRLRTDNSVSFDDYLQYARTGLIEAVDRFDPAEAVAFESFSFHRIRGAILNGLSTESELAAQRKAGLPTGLFERLHSLDHSDLEYSDEGILNHWLHKVVGVAIGLILDGIYEEPADDSIQANPYAGVELLYLRRRIVSYLGKLPTREAEIIRLHYFEHFEFQVVAEKLGITKSRVSQLHAGALSRLRRLLGKEGYLDASL